MKTMYGLTHNADGSPIMRAVRVTKVGIGLPAGKAIDVFIDQGGKWCVRVGSGRDAKITRAATMGEAQKFYLDAKAQAPDRKYPQRLSYFTFTRIASDGLFEPDWDAIAEHGPIPSEVDIVFTKDEPFSGRYEFWTAAELKCSGDGVTGSRVITMASSDQERTLAAQAERSGERYFPIVNGCYTLGCPYSKAQDEKHPAPCRPHGRLLFQLVCSPRLGSTAYFDTTGRRSIQNLFSSITEFKSVTGNGDPERGFIAGIPLKLVVRPYRTSHNGQAATQYGVSLEFRAESALDAKRLLIEHGVRFREVIAAPRKVAELEAASVPMEQPASAEDVAGNPVVEENGEILGPDGEVPPATAEAIAAEFYPCDGDGRDEDDEDDFATPPSEEAGKLADMKRRLEEAKAAQKPKEVESAKSETPAGQASKPAGDLISDADRRKFFAICGKRKIPHEEIHKRISEYRYSSTNQIRRIHYDALCDWAKNWAPSHPDYGTGEAEPKLFRQ